MEPPEKGPLKIGQFFLGKYEIRSVLGHGGHAWVYHACHRYLGDHVAIKILHKEDGVSVELKRRALGEGQILRRLDHPNIVKLDDLAITDDGLVYMIMELLRGRSLRAVLEEHGRLEVEEVLHIGLSVAEAMQAAHQAGVIHRDIKPDNVFLCANNHTKVIDFGVAKVEVEQAAWVTDKDRVLGTLYYMSPEQVQAGWLTLRSDIYALGVLMYEALYQHPVLLLLTGEQHTHYSVYTTIVGGRVPRLDEMDPRIPSHIAELVGVALNKNPNERYASMRDFADAIRKCLKAYADAAQIAGRVLQTRDLSRRVVTVSGVEKAGGSPQPDLDAALHAQDTHPASGPMFLGGMPSSQLSPPAPSPVAPALAASKVPEAQAPFQSAAQRPTVRALPNALRPPQVRPEDFPHDAPAVRTAPIAAQSVAAAPLSASREPNPPEPEHEHKANPAGLSPGIVSKGAQDPRQQGGLAQVGKLNRAHLPPVIVDERVHPLSPGPVGERSPSVHADRSRPLASPPAPASPVASRSSEVRRTLEGAPSQSRLAEPSGMALVPAGIPSPPSLGRLFAYGSLAGVLLGGAFYYHVSSKRASVSELSLPSAITVESVTQGPPPGPPPSAFPAAPARETEAVAQPEPAVAEPAAAPTTTPAPLPPRAPKPVVSKPKPVDKVEERVRRLEEEVRKERAGAAQPSSSSKLRWPIYE